MYDPAHDTWSLTQGLPYSPPARSGHTLVWSGSEMLLFGGISYNNQYIGRVYLFSPDTNTWLTPPGQAVLPRSGMSTVWTGSQLVIWGGSYGAGALNTGGRYDPALDAWTPTATLGAPAARLNHTAVWTGDAMIIWGGSGVSGLLNSGGRYDPSFDSWTPTSTVSAPAVRDSYSATWAGSRMIIWGGKNLTSASCCFLATGGRYDPQTDTWTPTSMTNAPSARYSPGAAWTGQTMLVWGGVSFFLDARGQRQYVYFNDGRRYDPVNDIWSTVSSLNAPPPRAGHSAIWTGDRVLVWGGSASASGQIELRGGLYDPVHDQWQATSTATPLNAFGGYTGIVWTGTAMIVWGQVNGPTDSGTGARYDPVLDSWIATGRAGAPPSGGALVWIGDSMLAFQEKMHRYHLSPDSDHDGVTVCGGDCNDGDPSVWAPPDEVANLMVDMNPSTRLSWTGQAVPPGSEISYDVVSGTVSPFDASTAVCLWSGAQTTADDGRVDPNLGQGFWYLVRGRNSCGGGTYGSPSLDGAIPPCP